MKTDGKLAGLPLGTDAGTTEGGLKQGADDEDVQRFASLMRVPASGAAVLAGLAGNAPPSASPAALLVEELAERLLVGEGSEGGDSVRVLAKDVSIPGLEVEVRREAGGLVVELMADHPADLTLLRGGAAELAARLEARFGTRAEVRVRRRGPGEQGGAG
jgi:hypothetical protein